jgi:hypothetical protein
VRVLLRSHRYTGGSAGQTTRIPESHKHAVVCRLEWHRSRTRHEDRERGRGSGINRSGHKISEAEVTQKLNTWGEKVVRTLESIFPTELEASQFLHAPSSLRFIETTIDQPYQVLSHRLKDTLGALDKIRAERRPLYTDLPADIRLYVEDIDSFRNVRDVNPATVADLLADGYWDVSEDFVQRMLEQILTVPFHKKDWSGEYNDLYTTNVIMNGRNTASAFLLKGHRLRKKMLQIKDCGKNGDQLVRLFESPAELYDRRSPPYGVICLWLCDLGFALHALIKHGVSY